MTHGILHSACCEKSVSNVLFKSALIHHHFFCCKRLASFCTWLHFSTSSHLPRKQKSLTGDIPGYQNLVSSTSNTCLQNHHQKKNIN